jgi:hypothetical protein
MKDNEQKKRTRTTRQATQTQPLLLSADAFVAALGAVLAEDWCRTWAAGRKIRLRRTLKRVKEVLDKMRLPAFVRWSRSFWDDARNGTKRANLHFVLRQLAAMTARCLVTTIELAYCEMKGQDAERLAGVLAQWSALAHLDLSGNKIGAAGAESLGECCRSAQRCLTFMSAAIRSSQAGQRGLQECCRSAHRWLTSISATIRLAILEH